jgi:4-hydroxy-tetrahydrodipicolinate reductase
MSIRVCLAGATGWAGSALARALARTDDLTLSAAVARKQAGRNLGQVLSEPDLTCPIFATAAEALAQPCDVFFEFTSPEVAKEHVLTALAKGVHAVIGTSGLTDDDYDELGKTARKNQCGVLAVGNFALTVVLLQKFAQIAARYIPQWEIIDYASDSKLDAPSGTVRELAHRLSNVRTSELTVPLEKTQGVRETRGARLNGSQVHSIRLPGYTISAEVIFGMPDEQLILRHDSGSGAQPYVNGALLAIRKVQTITGLERGLEGLLDLD